MSKITLVTGGARSGKSRFALEQCTNATHPVFIATAEVTDAEMAERIEKHRLERQELQHTFVTVEAPIDLAGAVAAIPTHADIAIVDCLTVWLGNLLHHNGQQAEPYNEVLHFLAMLKNPPCDLVIVANELGMGLVPENEMGRWFRDAAGRLNQDVAKIANETVFMVSGIPLVVKTCSKS